MANEKPEARLALRVHPGARRNEVISAGAELAHIRVAAPADKGKANAELVSFLAESLGVAKSKVRVLRGDFSHNKLIGISGLSLEEVVCRLTRIAAGKKEPQGKLI